MNEDLSKEIFQYILAFVYKNESKQEYIHQNLIKLIENIWTVMAISYKEIEHFEAAYFKLTPLIFEKCKNESESFKKQK